MHHIRSLASSSHRRNLLLVTEDLLATLPAGHAVLLLLAEFRRCQLLLLLVAFDFVAHSIKFVLAVVVFVRDARTRALACDPVVTWVNVMLVWALGVE